LRSAILLSLAEYDFALMLSAAVMEDCPLLLEQAVNLGIAIKTHQQPGSPAFDDLQAAIGITPGRFRQFLRSIEGTKQQSRRRVPLGLLQT
jgi:hypothetical protein